MKRRRGPRLVPAVACAATLAVALWSPIDRIGEDRLFWVHMIQHLLIGDVAPLLAVLAVDGPRLRPVLRFRAVQRLRPLAHPLVALPLWAASLAVWHLPVAFDAALAHTWVHTLQHASFFVCGTLVWAALLEPLPGPSWFTAAWKLPYVVAMWVVTLTISQVFLWSSQPYYGRYGVGDQRAGGGVMLVESSFVMVSLLVWLLLRVLRESESRQRLVETGVDARTAARAARYGRAQLPMTPIE